MISFIKLHSEFFIFLFLLFLTVDAFVILIKFSKNLDSLPNLKISYDIPKSYYLGFCYDNDYRLAIINLTIENKSTKPAEIIKIKLVNGSKSYSAIVPKIIDFNNENGLVLFNEDKSESINLDIISDNILLKNLNLPSQGVINGYGVFENIGLTTNTRDYTIVVETPKKTFMSQITLKPFDGVFQPGNPLQK